MFVRARILAMTAVFPCNRFQWVTKQRPRPALPFSRLTRYPLAVLPACGSSRSSHLQAESRRYSECCSRVTVDCSALLVQVTDDVMRVAADDAVFMHDMPAYREKEVATSVIDGPKSVIYQQAENRLHAQKALMVALLRGAPPCMV
jgi:aspartate/ornithine carbamoyltransferase-like protein